MQSNSSQSHILPSIRTLIAEEARKLGRLPFLTCALVLITMLIMVVTSLYLGTWWDSLWSAGASLPAIWDH
jgi:hypothetical protein